VLSGKQGRILCLTSNFPRWKGDSTTPFVLNLAQDIQRLGWQVDILAPHAPGCKLIENIDGIHVERFRYLWPEKYQSICYNGGALVNLRKDKTNYVKSPFLIACEWAAVTKRLKSRHYDLLHSHWILPQGFTGALSAGPLKIPHVLTVHGGDVFGLKGTILAGFKRFALNRADTITVNSSATQKAVESLIGASDKIIRIPMGVNVEFIDKNEARAVAIREKYRKKNGFLVVFVGRLVEEKGIGDLIEAVAIFKEKSPEVTAMIVGEGQDRPMFESQVKEKGLEDSVVFLGWVAPEKVPFYLAAADVFVGPSRPARDGWIEAQGLTFLEAMSANTPVIATRQGGIVDSVIDGKTGFLVEHSNPKEIVDKLLYIKKSPSMFEITSNAIKKVQNEFSREHSALLFSNLFQKQLD